MKTKMNCLKITNSFYCTEDTDTRLKYSVVVPVFEDEDVMNTFEPITSFGFQEKFKRTLRHSENSLNK